MFRPELEAQGRAGPRMPARPPDQRPKRALKMDEAGLECGDIIIAAAFDALSRREACALAHRLAMSAQFRCELADVRQIVRSLALLADEKSPSSVLRERVRQAIAEDLRDVGEPGNEPPPA